jgi:hypothetical protein
MKMKSAIKDDETSAGGQFSITYQDSGVRRIEIKMDRLEDLVWKLYEELDGKIQDLFDDHSNKFKQQNDIITNIFHGFGQEINSLKDEMQLQKSHVPIDADFVPQTQETPDEEIESSQEHFQQDSLEDEHRLVQYMTTHEDKLRKDTLEEVIEEVSKGKFEFLSNIIECLTDNRDDTRVLIPLLVNQTDSYDQSISNTQESKLMVANEKSPAFPGNRINLGSQDNSEHIDIYFS